MTESAPHADVVATWIERTATGRPSREMVILFGRAVVAIWERAHTTLGEVSLEAIMNRVLYNARTRFPVLVSVGVEAHVDSFRTMALGRDAQVDGPALEIAMSSVLTELLSLLGALTGEILSEPLHTALLTVHSAPRDEPVATTAARPAKNREERS